jgi:PAS domain S-box-containing protein
MDGMVFVASSDYRIEYMNEAALKKIGRDMTGKNCFAVFHGLEERCPWCMGDLVLQGQTVRQEIQGRLDKRWYSNVITPLSRKDGSVAIQALVFDITDQKQAQAALVQNEAILRSIHQAAPMGIGVVKSRVLDWTNEQISRMTGYSGEELRGKSARIFYADDEEFDRVGRHKYAEIHSKGTGSIVTVWRRKDGRLINVYLSSTPVDPGDLLAGVVFTALDITETKKTQDELWRSEEKYRTLFDNAVMGIFQSTPGGRFITVNPAAAKMCGYGSPEEMVAGITDIATQHYVDPAERDLFIRTIEEQGFVQNFEHRTFRKDGSVFWVSVTARVVRDRRGKITHYEGTREDIQWRKETEEALRQSEERFSKAFRSNPAPTAISTIDEGRFIEVNDRFTEAFGYGRDEIIGRTARELGFWEKLTSREEVIRTLRETGSIKNVLNHFRTRSGERRTGLWSGEIVRLGDRNVLLSILYDITEQKEAEERLRRSEEKYRAIFENTLVGIFQSSPDGRYIGVNPAFARMFGYSSPEDVVSSITDIGTQIFVDAKERRRCLTILNKTGLLERFETRTRRKDGSIIWTVINSRIVRDADGRPLFIEGIIEDVTEQKNAADALRASEERFFKVFQSNPIPMTIATIDDGRLIDVNERAIELSGYAREEMIGRAAVEIGLWANPEERDRLIAQLRKTGSLRDGRARIRTRAGHVRAALWSADAIRLGDKEVLLTTIQDVTEQVEAQEQVKQSEEKYRLLAENVTDVIWTADVNLAFTYVSPSSERLFGWSPSEWMSLRPEDFLPPASLDRVAGLLKEELEGPVPTGADRSRVVRIEMEVYRKDGSACWCEVSSQVLRDGDGNPVSLIGVTRDITERKEAEKENARLEQRLRQAQKMEAVGTLAGGIAHDFNNILFAVIGYAELCLQDIHDEDSRWNLSQILSACSRAKNLVNQILAFTHQAEQERKPLDLVPLTKETIKFVRSSLPSTIDIRLDAGTGKSTILGDATQIHQVIMNLCTNAAHAMRASGGRLRIVIDNTAPPAQAMGTDEKSGRPEGFVHLGVSDTGYGIEPAHLSRIFDPFFTTKAPGEGTGLGLSVVYGIVKSMEGTIHVQSAAGEGSRFDIYFPAILPRQAEPASAAVPIPRGTESILFVDDESHLIEVMSQMLLALGYRVTAATQSPKALELFLENPERFDLVITDMTMPGMTGAMLAREILQRRPDTPVILCTGYSDLINEEEALEMGIRRFLMKPLFMGDVAREIRAVLDAHKEKPTA